MPSHEPFKYQPLPGDGKSIRLIRILPSAGFESLVRCEMIHATTQHDYTALSYTWGVPNAEREVYVNGAILTARPNLWEFLRRVSLSAEYTRKMFWIDAICINQDDDKEKSVQVGRMGEIYKSAKHVLIWLSPYQEDAELALENSIGPICDFTDVASCLPNKERARLENDIPQFLSCSTFIFVRSICEQIVSHDYWRRLWIVQEFLLNGNRSILYGPLSISWKALAAYEEHRVNSRAERQRKIWNNSIFKWLCSPLDFLSFSISRWQSSAQYIKNERTSMAAHYGVSLPLSGSSQSTTSFLVSFLKFVDRVAPTALARIVAWRMDTLYVCLPYMEDTFRRGTDDDRVVEAASKSDFYLLVQGFAEQQCFDRRDKLYGLAALLADSHPLPIDYSIDVCETYYRALEFFLRIENSVEHHCSMAPDQVACGLLDAFKISPYHVSANDTKGRSEKFYITSEAGVRLERLRFERLSMSNSVAAIKSIALSFLTFDDCVQVYIDQENRVRIPCKRCNHDLLFSANTLTRALELQKRCFAFDEGEEGGNELVLILQCLTPDCNDNTVDEPSTIRDDSANFVAQHLLFYFNPGSGRPEALLSIEDETRRQKSIQAMPPDALKVLLVYLEKLSKTHSSTHTFPNKGVRLV